MLNRKLPVRASFVLVSIAIYGGTLAALALVPTLDQGGTWSAMQWLLGVVGAAIIGDTVRPSGQATSAFRGAEPAPTAPPGG